MDLQLRQTFQRTREIICWTAKRTPRKVDVAEGFSDFMDEAMRDFEVRVYNDEAGAVEVTGVFYRGTRTAINAAKRIAKGRAFEVWCNGECIHSLVRVARAVAAAPGDYVPV